MLRLVPYCVVRENLFSFHEFLFSVVVCIELENNRVRAGRFLNFFFPARFKNSYMLADQVSSRKKITLNERVARNSSFNLLSAH